MLKLLLHEAHQVLFAALLTAERLDCPETIVVVDETGDRVASARMDGAWSHAGDLAFTKAFASFAFDFDTALLTERDHPARQLFDSPEPEWLIYAGGVPLHRDGVLVGGVGVAGGDGTQDAMCARAGAGACTRGFA